MEIYILFFVIGLSLIYIAWQRKSQVLKQNTIEKQKEEIQELKIEKGKLEEKLLSAERMDKLLETRFQTIAYQILEKNQDNLVKNNKQQIDNILNPLQQNIREFKEQFRSSQDKSQQQNASLKTQLEFLTNLNQNLTTEAKNLTETLKGDSKKQGAWGEMVLEKVLEFSGLTKGREYQIQKQFTQNSEEGITRLRPDVILYLPANKQIIIDAKVSLKSYHQFFHSDEKQEKENAQKEFFTSIKSHIKALSQKNYENIPANSVDFVIMFIPIEPAFSLVLTDTEIYRGAYSQGVILASPSSLFAILKTVYHLWNLEKQNKHAQEIAEEAGKMYDKFVGFMERFHSIKRNLESSLTSYEKADKALSGQNSILDRVKRLSNLGIKTKNPWNKRL